MGGVCRVSLRVFILLVVAMTTVYGAFLGVRPLGIPDEARYAEIPREMLATGSWFAPTLNGLRYYEKPTLGYWATAAAFSVFGENDFAVRFPSFLSGLGILLLTYYLVARYRPEEDSSSVPLPLYILFTMLLFFILATLATLDCLFSFFITATFVTFYSAYKAQGRGEQTIALALLGVSVAGAFLTKGFLAFVIPFVGIVPFMVWERRFFDLFKLCWIPLLVVGALTVPWGLAMHAHSPDFWNFFFWNEHVRRFSSKDAQHSQPFWFYIPVLILGVLPWSFFFPSLVTARGKVTSSEIGRYALCWFLFPFILLSIASGKLPTYILPCFPPLAILLAIALEGRNEILSQSYMKRCAYGFSGLLAGGATIFALVCLFYSGKHPIYVVHSEWYKLLLIVGAALGWAFAWHHAVKNNSFKLFALGPVCLMVVASWIIPNRTLDQKFPEKLLREHQSEIPSNALFVSDQRLTASAGWILRRSDIYVFDWPGEMEYGFSYEDGKARWLVDIGALKALFAQNGGKQPIVLSGRSSKFKPAIEMLGPPTALYEDASHLIAVYK